MKAIHLKVCGMTTPLGIDDLTPRFTWNLTGGIKQTAFRLTACTADGETVCDSGVCRSGDMAYRYDGRTLQSRERIFWQICVWDENNREEWSAQSWFEMGLLSEKDWAARWICGVGTDCARRLPADYYKLEFTADKEIKKARLYATACGVYSARVNGKRMPAVLTPGCSEYEKHLYYQTFDITDSLRQKKTTSSSVSLTAGIKERSGVIIRNTSTAHRPNSSLRSRSPTVTGRPKSSAPIPVFCGATTVRCALPT